jgi:hypothetical protein
VPQSQIPLLGRGHLDRLGGRILPNLDGLVERSGINFGYRFDYLTSLRLGDDLWCILYENRGTKGLILKNGQHVREINRSYYCADDYDCPVVLFTLPSGRAAVIHCPDEYNRLEIEDAETGARLTARDGGKTSSIRGFRCRQEGSTCLVQGGSGTLCARRGCLIWPTP